MKQDEIIEMAREAGFVDYELDDGTTNAFDKRYETFANLVAAKEREALAQTQEPVAWIHNFIEGGISIGKRPADLNRHPDRWTALYKDPTPCPTCEALARTVMLDQTSHDTTPLERTWVGLTLDEIALLHANYPNPQGFALALQAKLKKLNT